MAKNMNQVEEKEVRAGAILWSEDGTYRAPWWLLDGAHIAEQRSAIDCFAKKLGVTVTTDVIGIIATPDDIAVRLRELPSRLRDAEVVNHLFVSRAVSLGVDESDLIMLILTLWKHGIRLTICD